MRLFVAVDLDAAARAAIRAEQKRVGAALADRAGLKWVPPGQMHLTLAFLGEVPQSPADAVVAVMQRDFDGPPFTATIGGLGVFPPHGGPKVLWVGVRQGGEALVAVQRQVVARLWEAGVSPEGRPFHPHLTLARWRDGPNADRRRVADADRGHEVASVLVDRVTLYRSVLSSEGPAYSVLAHGMLR